MRTGYKKSNEYSRNGKISWHLTSRREAILIRIRKLPNPMPLAKFKPRPVLGLEPPEKSSRMKQIWYLCAIALMRAVEKYFKEIGTSQGFTNRLSSRFDCDITRQNDRLDHYDEEDKWAALVSNGKRFRKDRAFIWDLLEEAVREYFNDYGDGELPVALGAMCSSEAVKVVVKATRAFAMVLGDAEASAYMKKYWTAQI